MAGAAHLLVDTNRDGQLTPADEPGKNAWTSAAGAVFAWNNDNDGQRKPASMAWTDVQKVLDCSDTVMNGQNDARSDGIVVASRLPGTTPTSVTLAVTPRTAPVRIFMANTSGNWTQLIAPGAGSGQIPVAQITAGDVNLLVEGTGPRTASWDGTINVTLTVAGPAPSNDSVCLREAPVIFTDNTRPALIVYAMMIDDPNGGPNTPFWNVLSSGLQAQNVPLYSADQNTYGFDRWVQDNMQIGYEGFAGPNGYDWIHELNQLERGAGAGGTPGSQASGDLWSFLPNDLLGPNAGMAYAGPSASQDSPNYGGNFEVLPPYSTAFPFGRYMHGGGNTGTLDGSPDSRHMNPEEVAFVTAQGMQVPDIEISSEWLAVGHLDEFLMAVPDFSASPPHPFKILWSSPALAIQALKQLQSSGHGTAAVFAGTSDQTTVNAILGDANLMTFNDEAQARLDSDRSALKQMTGLTDADFIQMPVFYMVSSYGGLNYAVAENPGVQNCIPVNDTLYMPNPSGPQDPAAPAGQDVWQTQILKAVAPTGLKIVWVDVYTSYHQLMGEAHCGSNVLYEPYSTPWWQK